MCCVGIERTNKQSLLSIHRLREGYKEECTACINRIRGLLAEFGLVFPQSPKALREVLACVIADEANELGYLARLALQRAHLHWIEIDTHIAWCDERIAVHVKANAQAVGAARLTGVGPVTASAVVASVGKFSQFANARQFAAWLGLVPKQNSSGGKASLGHITKRGDTYLRTLLIQGTKSAVMTAHQRKDRISQWTLQLRERLGWQKPWWQWPTMPASCGPCWPAGHASTPTTSRSSPLWPAEQLRDPIISN